MRLKYHFCLLGFSLSAVIAQGATNQLATLAVAAGQRDALALRSDGTVWAWGTNRVGELGLGTNSLVLFPKKITSLTNMISISAGPLHSLAVQSNGLVWAWGTNGDGRLGNGTFNNASNPVVVSVITNAVTVAAGGNHSLAALADGRVMAWGANNGGQLGTGNTTATNQPVQVGAFTNVVITTAGSNFSLALTAAGEVWSWGTNAQGQLGLGNNTTQLSPVKISILSNIVQIAAGGAHALARDQNGNVYAWGTNANGQLGDGTTTTANAPKTVLNLGATNSFGPAQSIAAGYNSSAAVSANGKLCYWGNYTNNAVFFGNATSPVQIGGAVDATFTTVAQGENFLLARESDGAAVWAWGLNQYGQWGNDNPQIDDWRYEAVNPSYSFGARPRAFMVRFHRGDRANLPYNSFVLPLDLEEGVRLNAEGSEQYCYGTGTPWFMRVQKATRQHVFKRVGATTNVTRFPVENALAGYGSEAGGSPLYTGQPYTFGVYAGAFNENTGQTNVIRVLVYDRTALAAGTNNVAPTNVFTISLPRRNIAADNTAWSNYVTNGNRVLIETNGLRTSVEFSDDPDAAVNAYNNWGVYWQFAIAPNVVLGGYRLTHTATSTNYCYVVEVQGQAEVGANVFAPMATTNTTVWSYSPMYALGFEQFPEWRSRFVDNPHFEGIPLPPAYAGRRVAELNGMMAVVTNNFWLTNNAAYSTNDSTPELRRHPVLDRFVEDMGRNPLALASYVLNEIELTDPMGYIESSKRVNDSIEVGGVNRSALGTFLEGQGSPTEQCALLVYLLRQAGYSAGYVFPTNNNMRLLDTTVSRLWQINVKGVVFHAGVPVITNSLIAVNYPWVVANIGTNCVHIFPWMKDTEIVEGSDIYDFMPTNYPKAYQWVKDYAYFKPEVLGTVSVNEPMMKAWKQFLTGVLNTNQQESNLSLDDFGVRAFNRRNSYASWEQLPRPNFLTNQTQLITVPTLSESATTYPFLTNMFDRVRVEVFKTDTNTSNRIFDTGLWRACDFHNRKLLLYTNGATSATLWLATYRPEATNSTGNFTSFETGLGSLNKQVVTATVTSGVSLLPVRITYQRRVGTLASAGAWYPAQEFLQDSFVTTPLKRDVTAIIPSVSRVSSAMLRMHAEDYWKLEQQRALNSSFTPDVTEDAGTTGMLLASSFFEKLWTDDQFNQRLHKVHGLTWNSWGTAALTKQSGGLMQLKMSMNWFATQVLGNARMRQDSGDRSLQALDNYLTMLQAHGSSAEHTVISSLFNDNDAVSSVRLMQLAAERNRTNGLAAPLELNIKNFTSLGNSAYTGYGTTLLKNHDPAFWQRVTNVFVTPDKDFARVLTTPGPVTNVTGSFKGMSALIFGKSQTGAILSDNSVILNGGWSAQLYYVSPPTFNTYQLTYSLQYSPTFGYSFIPNNFVTAQPHYNFSHYDLVTLTAATGATKVAFTPYQTNFASLVGSTLNLPGVTTAQAVKTGKDVGWLDKSWAGMKQFGSKIADPVQVVSGDFYADTMDLTLAGPMPLQLRRNYQSRTLVDNQFGPGWKLGFTPWLVLSTNAQSERIIHAAEPDGAVLAYRLQSNDVWTVTAENNPTLVNFTESGIGSKDNLFQNRIEKFATNGTTCVLTAADGSKRTYQEMTGFGLTSGTNFLNRIRPYLTKWEDHAGNYHSFQYGTNSADNDFGQLYRVQSANGAALTLKYDVNGRITDAMTDDDQRVRYQYDNYGDLVLVTLPDNSQWEYEYQHYTFTTNSTTYTDSNHLLVRETKPNGRMLANTYDSLRRITIQAATVGTNRELVTNAWFFYTNNCNSLTNEYLTGTTRVEDVFHNVYLYQYTSNLITRIDEPTGRVKLQDWFEGSETNKTGYYPRSLELAVDPRNLTNEFRYSTQGNITNRIVPGNLTGEGVSNQSATNTFTYNTNQLLLTATDPTGNQRAFYYEDSGDLYRATRVEWSKGGTSIATNRFTYTNVTETVSLGLISKTNRAFGLLAREIRADAATNEWSYNGRGFAAQSVRHARTADNTANNDPAVVDTFTYTARGNLSERSNSAGRRVRFNYDAMGRLQWREVIDENGVALAREHFYYNRNGELEWYDGPRSGPEDYVWFDYDGAGRKVQEISWRSRAKVDGTGVEAEPGDNLYATTSYRYDGFGNLTLRVDARGAITTNSWDALGRLVQQKSFDLNGSTVLATAGFAYEAGGLIRYHTNALGGVSEVQYTSTGQPSFQRGVDGATNGWTYYLDGRIRREIQGNGAYWETTYDDANLKTTRIFYSFAGSPLATNIAIFDRRGNQVQQVDAADNVFTNFFDGLDRLKSANGPVVVTLVLQGMDPGATNYVTNIVQQAVTNFYDAAGVVVTNVNALGEKSITYTDALGRVTRAEIRSVTNAVVRESSMAYSQDHHSVTVTNGSGSTAIASTAFTDNDGRTVLSIAYPAANAREFTRREYDLAGNLFYEERDSSANGTTTLWSGAAYAYDGLNRLTVKSDRDAALTYFYYDAAGNLTNRLMPGGLQWQARYSTASQLLEEKNVGNGGAATRTNTYSYYAAGNPFAGLLQTRIDGRTITSTYTYDDWLRVATNIHSTAEGDSMLSTWRYDTRGFLTNIYEHLYGNLPIEVRRGYDAYGQLVSEGIASQSWDAAGRRTKLDFPVFSFGYSFGWRADGRLASVSTPNGGATYDYTTAGVLPNRSVGSRVTSVTSLDGVGRPLAITTKVSTLTKLTETLAWTTDGLLSSHTLAREDFTDSRSYGYASLSRRLTNEWLNLDGTKRWTNTFTYDSGVASGPGVLSKAGQTSNSWSGGTDSFSRIYNETNTVSRRPAYGRVNGQASVTAFLDGQPMPITQVGTGDTNWVSQWRTTLELAPGAHQLQASAVHPSGLFTTNASVWFTNNAANETVSDTFDGGGYLTQRIWKSPNGTTNRTQTLIWDPKGRLYQVYDLDSQTNGFLWWATYDGLGRRYNTRQRIFVGGQLPPDRVFTPRYDPLVEFLEVGVFENRNNAWKLYGPDLNGVYGGLNGTGGLEAVAPDPFTFSPTIADARGNVLGAVTNGVTVSWTAARPTGYGAVPGYRPLPYGYGGDMVQSSAWRGRSVDITGLMNLGARLYNPESGSFLNSDPVWNGSDPNYYTFAGGDPVNYFDGDGRLGKAAVNYAYTGGAAGYGLRTLGGAFEQIGYSTESTYLNWQANNNASFFNFAAGVVTPRSYVEGANNLIERSSTVMAGDMVRGSGGTWTGAQGLSSILGDATGYNSIMEGGFGVDRQTSQLLNRVDRTSRTLMGGSQLILTGMGLRATYQPGMVNGFVRIAPVVSAVPPVIANAANTGARFSRVGGAAGDFLVPGEATLQAGLRDPALYGTRLSTTPTFNAALEPLGQVTGRGLNASVEIGAGGIQQPRQPHPNHHPRGNTHPLGLASSARQPACDWNPEHSFC